MPINIVDLVIAVGTVAGLANGYRRGVILSITQYVGLVVGVIVGATGAPALLDRLSLYGTTARPVAAAIVLVLAGGVGWSLGYWIGFPLRRSLLGLERPGGVERVLGAAVSGLMVLSTAWFLGQAFHRGPSPAVAQGIQESAILQRLDQIAPEPPGFLSGVEKTLAAVPFPQTFVPGLQPSLPQPLKVPAEVNTAQVNAASQSVYRVEGRGCGGLVTGSAYPVASGYLVTNAHVVSGTHGTRVTRDDPAVSYDAQVVLFDPERDVAVLRVPGLRAPVLPQGDGARGTPAAVLGYPGGGNEQVAPAVINSQTAARGRDIYDNGTVTRQIWIFGGTVQPGNSGGPIVDLQGHVLGLVFAASSTDANQAYALTNAEIQADVQQGSQTPQAVDTSGLSCAV
ncbi:MAG: MarP family serine protease [Candidatus Dormibacteraeota bacterium]|nr:MarP family serine protease [Candidatus Dormibacteraeota bacterium]MBO0761163.1 MarP family serine protease [Candidatus Dormibacteraeota bacterium]